MKSNLAWLGVSSFVIIACGGSTTTIGDGGTDAGPTNDATVADTSTNDTGSGNDATTDSLVSCGQSVNLTFGNCPAAPTCGGTIVDGTYDYTTGCIADPWAQAKQNCQTLQVSNEQGTVKGCITFAGGTSTRNVQTSYSATLAVPTSCLFGGTCAQLQALLNNAITATCTNATSGCTCDVSSTSAGIGTTTYTTVNNQVVTSTNVKYDYCVGTGTIDMQWASGGNPEPGVYTLTKQ